MLSRHNRTVGQRCSATRIAPDTNPGHTGKNAGYECAYGGKWHVPELDIPDKVRGFDQIYKHSDDGLAEACVEFLSRKHNKPFFLVASYDNPHNICEYARSQNLPYGNLDIPEIRNCPGLPPNFAKNPYDADVIEKERENNFNVYPTATFTPEDWRMYRYTYYRLVEKVDREIGKIVDAIDKNNLWENTVVIFSSDHGDGIGAHHWNQKSALYEEVVNIPFIVTLPGKKHAGTKLPQLISNGVDFFATVCDWAGAKLPEDADGKSFRKIAEEGNPQAPHQEYVITETQFDGSKTRGWMVRTARYKYVLYDKGRHREQLFDMQNDRGETRNLMMENAYTKVAQEHRDILEKFMNSHKSDRRVPNCTTYRERCSQKQPNINPPSDQESINLYNAVYEQNSIHHHFLQSCSHCTGANGRRSHHQAHRHNADARNACNSLAAGRR